MKAFYGSDFKYLLAYLLPLSALLGIYLGGAWSFGSMYVGFVALPLAELFLTGNNTNMPQSEEAARTETKVFDWLLYANVPLLYLILGYAWYTAAHQLLTTTETVGMICNVGLVLGTTGINVAHELGHRSKTSEVLMARLLLIPALYTHFNIEHNLGHHKHVATRNDPASARYGEILYFFWIRSTVGSYFNAWKIETQLLKRQNRAFFSIHNRMILFTLAQMLYLAVVYLFFGWTVFTIAIGAAVFGFLMLESVNYIEHYGLERSQTENGRYESVKPWHSWNSNHEAGRIFLYELTRHSDHHYKASRKYQILKHWQESPQLPTGYPGSILLSLVPPLWFWMVHKQLKKSTV